MGNNTVSLNTFHGRQTDEDVIVDSTVQLEVRRSTLPCYFEPGWNAGLFTVTALKSGTILGKVNDDIFRKMNDGAIDIETVVNSKTATKFGQGLLNMHRYFINPDNYSKRVNVREVQTKEQNYYETICDLPAGSELTCIYGFGYWLVYVMKFLTNKTLPGYMQFLHHFNVHNDMSDQAWGPTLLEAKDFVVNKIPDLLTKSLSEFEKESDNHPEIKISTINNVTWGYSPTSNNPMLIKTIKGENEEDKPTYNVFPLTYL